jgi:ribosomal protein L37E
MELNMSLKQCRECKHEVSKKAKTCPNCGVPKPAGPKQYSFAKLLLVSVTVLFLYLAFSDPVPTPAGSPGVQTNNNSGSKAKIDKSTLLVVGKLAVKKRLKDPDSAEFKDVFANVGENISVACGYVNSKNSFGGYTGYQRFISNGLSEGTFLENEMEDVYAVWNKLCI